MLRLAAIIAVAVLSAAGACSRPQHSLSGEWVGAVRTSTVWYPARIHLEQSGSAVNGTVRVGTLSGEVLAFRGQVHGSRIDVHIDSVFTSGVAAKLTESAMQSDQSQFRGDAVSFFRSVPIAAPELREYIGWYEGGSGMTVVVTRASEGGLRFFGLGRLSGTLVRDGADAFRVAYFDQASTLLHTPAVFSRDARGQVTGLSIGHEPVKNRTAFRRRAVQPYRQDLVEFTNGNVMLHGTLFLPARGPARAAVVYIHGTGHNTADRPYEMSMLRTYLDSGIAVLLYDKRGSGMSGGDWRTSSLYDLANDAAAAVRLLRAHSSINPDAVGVYGISEGGWVAPLVAQLEPSTAFVINHGGPAVSPLEDELDDLTTGVASLGLAPADTGPANELIRAWIELYRSPVALPRYQSALAAVRNAEWFKPFAQRFPESGDNWEVQWWRKRGQMDAEVVWTNRRARSLVLIGERDDTMIVPKNVALFEQYARNGPAMDIRLVPGADHGLRASNGFVPGFPASVAEWILAAGRTPPDDARWR